MQAEQILAFSLFATVTSITPGPNNTMLLASGLNFGFQRSLPHLFGVCIGFSIMLIAIGLGLDVIFNTYPSIQVALKYIGALYMLWMAWQLGHAGPLNHENAVTIQPLSLIQAMLFQWVNPKAWIIAMGAISAFLPHDYSVYLLVGMALLFGLIALPCNGVWNWFGISMRQLLSTPKTMKAFNYLMALILVTSIIPVLYSV